MSPKDAWGLLNRPDCESETYDALERGSTKGVTRSIGLLIGSGVMYRVVRLFSLLCD